jgi:hypothetical protein
MARQFNGTDQSLQSASTIDLSSFDKLSLAFWLWWDAFADDDDLAMEFSADYNGVTTGFIIDPNDSSAGGGNFGIALKGDVGYSVGQFTRPSNLAWHQYVIVLDKTKAVDEVDAVYVDGISQTLGRPQNNNNTNAFGNHTLNFMSRNNTSLFGAGRLAEVAIYGGVNLTQQQATDLQTMCPNFVGTPTYGWHLDGDASPEPAFVGGIALNLTGTIKATHPIVCRGDDELPADRRMAFDQPVYQ